MSIGSLVEPLLRRVALFQGLRSDQLIEIARRAERVQFKPGDTIIREGQPGDAAYLIVSGTAQRTAGPDSDETAELQPGTLIGEMAMLVETDYSSTVVCRDAAKSLRITRSSLLEQMGSDLSLADHILEQLAGRLRHLARELKRIDDLLGAAGQPLQAPPAGGCLLLVKPQPQSAHSG